MKATIQFKTTSGTNWCLTREFNSERHLDNFTEHVCKTKRYLLDEVWIHEEK